MIVRCLVLLFFCFSASYAQTQPASIKAIQPIPVDRSALSGVGLKKINLKDEPDKEFFQKSIFRGADISVYIVSSESWNSNFEAFWFDEFICILHGQAQIRPVGQEEQTMYAGDLFFAPKGYNGEWEIQAGDQYHYELSVISTERASKEEVAEHKGPVLLDRQKLSGSNIILDSHGEYHEKLVCGPELTIHMLATTPGQKLISDPSKEQMIHILSGQIRVGLTEEEAVSFYTGDYFILPKGFVGYWKSEGHSIVKYLSIQKTASS